MKKRTDNQEHHDSKQEWKEENKALSKRLKTHWRKLYDSTKEKMTRGAKNIKKIITWPRGDNWRRDD